MENKAKKKSTLLKDAVALFLITLISGLALAYVFEVTKDPIIEQQKQKKLESYLVIFPEANEIVLDEALTQKAKETELKSLDPSYSKAKVDEVNVATDASGAVMGYVVVVTTKEGYKPPITVAIGYTMDRQVAGLEYLIFKETKSVDTLTDVYRPQYINKVATKFTFKKGTQDTQVNAVSGATVSSKAILNAVNAGIGFLNEYAEGLGGAGK